MSILIKGMEMPRYCGECQIMDDETLECRKGGHRDKNCFEGIYSNCPLVPVPPHGRLIDADAHIDDMKKHLWDWSSVDGITATTVLKQAISDLENAPTIIPAEAERSET